MSNDLLSSPAATRGRKRCQENTSNDVVTPREKRRYTRRCYRSDGVHTEATTPTQTNTTPCLSPAAVQNRRTAQADNSDLVLTPTKRRRYPGRRDQSDRETVNKAPTSDKNHLLESPSTPYSPAGVAAGPSSPSTEAFPNNDLNDTEQSPVRGYMAWLKQPRKSKGPTKEEIRQRIFETGTTGLPSMKPKTLRHLNKQLAASGHNLKLERTDNAVSPEYRFFLAHTSVRHNEAERHRRLREEMMDFL